MKPQKVSFQWCETGKGTKMFQNKPKQNKTDGSDPVFHLDPLPLGGVRQLVHSALDLLQPGQQVM